MNYENQLEQSVTKICKNKYEYFLKKKNVVGVGFGYKVIKGFRTCQKCIQVFVIEKIPNFKLCSNDVIPSNFNGIPTDVIETGIFASCSLREKIRPVLGGYSIGAMGSGVSGTAGCLVSNGVLQFVLSSNHVIAGDNAFPLGKPIVQPSNEYGGISPKEIIGTLHQYVPLRFIEGQSQPINLTDAAIGLLKPPNILKNEIALIGKINCVKNAKLNDTVKKVGSTTGLTQGTVTSINATITVRYVDKRALFQDVIRTTRMSELGDSGSILLNKSNCAIGILLSGGRNNTTFCNLNTTLSKLGVHIVN